MTSNGGMMFIPLLVLHPVEEMIRNGGRSAFHVQPHEVLFIVPRGSQEGEFIFTVQVNRWGNGHAMSGGGTELRTLISSIALRTLPPFMIWNELRQGDAASPSAVVPSFPVATAKLFIEDYSVSGICQGSYGRTEMKGHITIFLLGDVCDGHGHV